MVVNFLKTKYYHYSFIMDTKSLDFIHFVRTCLENIITAS